MIRGGFCLVFEGGVFAWFFFFFLLISGVGQGVVMGRLVGCKTSTMFILGVQNTESIGPTSRPWL